MTQLLGDVFRMTFVDTIPIEQQLSDMWDKVHRLRDLGHDLKDLLIATVIMISLLESYTSLRQHLYIKNESTLTTDFVVRQILMDEKVCEGPPHVALMSHGKGKKPVYQSTNYSCDHEGKKREVKCFYYNRVGHIRLECKKMKADLGSHNSSSYKKRHESQEESVKLASTTQETLIKLFMACEGSLDLSER